MMDEKTLKILGSIVGPTGLVVLGLAFFYFNQPNQNNAEFQRIVMDRLGAVEESNEECMEENQELMRELGILKTNLIVMQASSDSAPFAAWMKNTDGKMIFVNAKYEAKFLLCRGFTKEDYLGKDDYAVWPKEVADSFRKNDAMVLRDGRLYDFYEDVETCDRGTERLRFVKWPRRSGSQIVGIDGMYVPEVGV